MKTYNPKQVSIALGNHIVTGYAEDTFVNIEQQTDGITMKVGCDGEVVRSVSPDNSFNITLSLLMYSPTNKFLNNKRKQDRDYGNGTFPVIIKDILGNTLFTTNEAWVVKAPAFGYGRESANREWVLACGEGDLTQN